MFSFRSINLKRFPIRCLSTMESLVDLAIDGEGIALISMKRHPVNSLNLEVVQEISSKLDIVQKNQCKGLVLTSAARIFSAGLDLNEFNKPDLQRLRTFWWTIQDLFLKIYASGEITSAVAINGYSAAGGTAVSLLFDYRVMVSDDRARIGVNDTLVGIVPSPWLCSIMSQVMGHKQAEIALTASTMYTAEEALKVNLIDETATDKEDAIEKCKQFIRKYDNIPTKIKAKTQRNLRAETIRLVEENREEDTKLFTEGILDPYAQKQIDSYVKKLKSK